jgi:hypothetical protein
MKLHSATHRPAIVAGATIGILALGLGGTAVGAAFITGSDVKDGSLTGADIKTNSITYADIANNNIRSTEILDGSILRKDLNQEVLNGLAVDTNWGTVLRNTIESADTTLRQGPGALANVPLGKGSLEINVANSASKAAYGNEVDFAGAALSTVGSPSFSVYQTGENNGISAGNLPNIAIEVLSTGTAGYSTLNFVPTKAAASNAWTSYTAADGYWYFTGGVGTSTSCGSANQCTLAQVKAAVPNAKIISVAISKGRDSAWHGAVDKLVVGTTTYDFEARGVIATVAP